jgi:DNA uptake protein ComE-like DNA-binding protein
MVKRAVGAVIVTFLFMLAGNQQPQNVGGGHQVNRRAILAQVETAPSASTATPASYLRNPLLYLSTAPPDSLILLPGIGPVLAERIARARTGKRLFTRWEDLLVVKGIGPKKVDRLRSLSD